MAEEHEEWTPYQKMEAGILKDISCDTDEILKKLEGVKMGEGFDMGALMGMLANKGVDPNVVAVLNDKCRNGNWGEGGGIWIVLLFLFLLGIGGGNGFFGNRNGFDGVAGVDRTVVNEANYSRLLDALGTQGTRQEVAIQGLAQTLNCDLNSIKCALNALNSIDKQLAVNQGSIINAVQNVGCQLGQQISACCCETRRAIENQGCQTRADIQDVRFLISSSQAAQDNLIQSQFAAQNAYLADQFCQIKMRELESINQRLRDDLFRQSQQSQTAQIIQAIRGMDTIAFSGTAGATAVTGTGTIS